MRVVSLLPAATELVAALGAGGRLVGRSHECDFPPEVLGAPTLTAPRLDPALPSGAIDGGVRALVEQALSIFRIDAEALRALQPDLVLTQDLCRVCAVSLDELSAALAEWSGARLLSFSPRSLAELWLAIAALAAALGLEAGVLLDRMKRRLAAIAVTTGGAARPTVLCLEWLDPPLVAGNWTPELIAIAGGRDLFGTAGQHPPPLAWEAVAAAAPEVILLAPCSFPLGRVLAEAGAVTGRPGWANLPAVRQGRVFAVDGARYLNRPGPRLVHSTEILAEILHSDRCPPRHHGDGWVRLEG